VTDGVDVTIARNICIGAPSFHMALPPAGSAKNSLHAELPCNIAWPPGGAVGAHKLTKNVFHLGSTIALSGHDCGIMVLHWCVIKPWPPNPALAVIIPFSERKVRFSSSLVKMNGEEAALASVRTFMPMSVCSAPFALPVMHVEHSDCTVFMGWAGADFAAGWADIAIDVVAEMLTKPKAGKSPIGTWQDQVGEKLAGAPDKKALLTGLAKGLVSYGIKGKGKFEVGLGSPYRGEKIEFEFERDPNGILPVKASSTSESRDFTESKTRKLEWSKDDGLKAERGESQDQMGGWGGGGNHSKKQELDLQTGKSKTTKERTDRGAKTHEKKEGDGKWHDWIL